MSKKAEHCHHNKSFDYILWVSLFFIVFLYVLQVIYADKNLENIWLRAVAHTVFSLINTIWWGIIIGIVTISVLSKIPKELVVYALGSNKGIKGIIRATIAGVLLDLCSHGILMVASKLYERGASIGQVIAFLISSPWNSFSLTIILITLIGIYWTIAFILLSMLIAIISGVIFDKLVSKNKLPNNPNKIELKENFEFWLEVKKWFKNIEFSKSYFKSMLISGILESRLVIRWILFGVLLAAIVKASINADNFQTYFGPSLAGLGLTIFVATIIEVCSEGSTPIAADILTRAKAPGNSFAFLMAGVSTDYTEIMVLKETTKSWKISLFLPLITLPQVIIIAYVINHIR